MMESCVSQAVREFPVDQDKSDSAITSRAIGPTVIGTPLNHDVARASGGLAVIYQQSDFALEHDPVVDRLGAMHERMTGVAAAVSRCACGTHFREVFAGRSRIDPLDILGL